jgi:hypothetical protein
MDAAAFSGSHGRMWGMRNKKTNLWPLLPFAVLFFFVAVARFLPEAHAENTHGERVESVGQR